MRRHREQPSGEDSERPDLPDFGESFFERMVAEASDAVVTADAEGTIVYANEAVEDLLGYAPEDLLGAEFTEFVPERFRDRYDSWHRRYSEGEDGTPLSDETFELTWQTADGGEQRLSVSSFDHQSDGERLITGFLRKAPERDATGELLREEEALVEELFDTSPVAISVRDADGELLRANDRAAELVGIDPDELSEAVENEGKVEEWSLYDADGNPQEHPVEQTLRTGEPLYNEEIVVERPGGDRAYLSASVTPIYEDGEISRVVTAAEDVTELKETQFELERRRAELETELSEVFARIDDAFFALNDGWEFTYVNDEAEDLLRRTEGELIGKNLWEEFPDAVGSTFEREYRSTMETQEQTSFVEYFPPLSAWFEVYAYPSETGLSVYFQDVTDRIERERELERYETIVETVEDGIFILNDDMELSMVNSAVSKMTGYDREELLGTPIWEFVDGVQHLRDDIEELDVEMYDGERDAATIELDVTTKDGGTVPVEATWVLRGSDGEYERVGVVRDVTERKERERERREHERKLEEQNERLDAFASMLAHELRNPLEIAQIYLGMGVEQAVDDDADTSTFQEVERALDRIEEMIDTLLVVTRRGGEVDTTEVMDLGEVAAEWWETVDPDGTLVVETDRLIRADSSRLRQLLENLYRNAEEHGEPGVTVRIGDLEEGFYVEDDGPGIPEDERRRVFEPGYSTSNVGIGFGLAVVRQLVEAHGWDCEVTESSEGGARFEFTGVDTLDE